MNDSAPQGTAGWLADRCGKIGGSSVGDLTATKKSGGYTAARADVIARVLVERLTGQACDNYVSWAMQRGLDLEAAARDAYERECGVFLETTGWVPHPSIVYAGVSPDALVNDDGIVDFKCCLSKRHVEILLGDEPEPAYVAQIHWTMAVTGRMWGELAYYHPEFPEHLRLKRIRFERDADIVAHLEAEVRKALAEVDDLLAKLGAKP